MEEQKKKIVEMKSQVQRPEKMSYEQLENVAHQLSEQNRQLFAKLQELNMANMFKRLDYLFKVVENTGVFSIDFHTRCVEEIESLMTIPEEPQEEKKETTEE